MPSLLIDPLNLNSVLIGIAALISAGYFLRVPDKSAATWFLLASLLSWATWSLVTGFWAFTHLPISTDADFQTSVLGRLVVFAASLPGPFTAQAAYHFRGNAYRRESWAVLAVSILTPFVILLTLPQVDNTLSAAILLGLNSVWSAWGMVVLLRKRHGTDAGRDRASLLVMAGFVTIVAVASGLYAFYGLEGSPTSVGISIVAQVAQFMSVLAFPIAYAQYAPEPTTFQVKLVGFVLLVVLSAFGALGASRSVMDKQRQAFDPSPAPHRLTFEPSGSGYVLNMTPEAFDSEIGDNLNLNDDSRKVVSIPFGFPFAGDTLHAVVVEANGAIHPSETPYYTDSQAFSMVIGEVTDRPLIAAWYTDMNPGAGGGVYASVRSDRLVVTWKDVPEWNFFLPHTFQAVLYASGRIDFDYAAVPFGLNVGASGVLVEPASYAGPTSSSVEDLVASGPVRNPFVTYDRRLEFKQYLHRETMPFVWAVLGTLAFVLLVAPLFYRMSLTRPLDRLLVGMRRVNEGDLAAELPVGVDDEFGKLAHHFNQMTGSLRTYAHEMEGLVAERTAELDASLQSLKATQEQLVQQEKLASLGQLTAGIAHEIKNPLNFINNFSEVNAELMGELQEALARGEDPAELIETLRKNAEVISDHGHRADRIVRSMMEHARPGGTTREPVIVNDFVEEAAVLAWHGHRTTTIGADVRLERSYAPDAGTISVVRQDFGRVLINLVGNALDSVSAYKAAGAAAGFVPTVTVSTRREADGSVVIEVTDNGPGVPDDLKKRIFEPFFTTKPTGQGTGLGLSLSFDIVTSGHGGTLAVEDAPGGGARFVMTIPETGA